MESMDDFDVAVQTIVKQQTDYKARVKLLQAENEKLRKNLEDQLRTSKNLLNDELTKGESPTKFMRHTSLRSASVVQRLVANAASPRYISEDEEQHIVIHKTQQQQLEDEEEEEEEQPASEIRKKKSRFSLIAPAGDERDLSVLKLGKSLYQYWLNLMLSSTGKKNQRWLLSCYDQVTNIVYLLLVKLPNYLLAKTLRLLLKVGRSKTLLKTTLTQAHSRNIKRSFCMLLMKKFKFFLLILLFA